MTIIFTSTNIIPHFCRIARFCFTVAVPIIIFKAVINIVALASFFRYGLDTDFLFLMQQTGLTWGNLSSHLSKLEAAGYVAIEKEFLGKKPHTMLRLEDEGRAAFETYRKNMKQALDDLPDK